MYNISDVIKYNIKVPFPRWIKGMDQKSCFATSRGWVIIRQDNKKESVMMIRGVDSKIDEYIKTHNIIVEKTALDLEFEKLFNESDINNNIPEQPSIAVVKDIKEVKYLNTSNEFDFIELEEGVEDKPLRKNNLIRIYLTWTCPVNIRSFDKKRTYIEVFDSKNNKLGNAEYRSRETEKTLMFVYKIGKEKLNSITISSKIFDGLVRTKENTNIDNIDKRYSFDVNVNH